jgi:hypothetical protein
VQGDETLIGSATDTRTEHAKAVQISEQRKFNVMGDEKLIGSATTLVSVTSPFTPPPHARRLSTDQGLFHIETLETMFSTHE